MKQSALTEQPSGLCALNQVQEIEQDLSPVSSFCSFCYITLQIRKKAKHCDDVQRS